MKIIVMDLKEIEARNDCAGEDQQQFSQPTGQEVMGKAVQSGIGG
jgi:hypothetical protein